jgi:hypothetical protein
METGYTRWAIMGLALLIGAANTPVRADDYAIPEHAWWRDYEAINAERRADTWRGQAYRYIEPRSVSLRGRIVELREFRSSEWTQPHVVVFVETERSRELHRVVLGPVDRVAAMDIRVGDRITASGTRRVVDGVRSVVAARFETPAVRWSREYADIDIDAVPPAGRWYRGEVRNEEHEDINGARHILVRVELNTGENIQVDLGPTYALPGIDFDDGDVIDFFGRWGALEGRATLFADRFRWRGQLFLVDRGFAADVHAYR